MGVLKVSIFVWLFILLFCLFVCFLLNNYVKFIGGGTPWEVGTVSLLS